VPLPPAWLVVRYQAALTVFRDPRFVKNPGSVRAGSARRELPTAAPLPLIGSDPPDHTWMRALLSGSFSGRAVESRAPRVQELVSHLLDRARPNGQMDLIREYATVLPITLIGEIVGLSIHDLDDGLDPTRGLMPAALRRLRGVIAARRAEPRDDLISVLVKAELGDDRITTDLVLRTASLVVMAGYMTTVNLIGNGTLALLTHPDQLEMLRRDPALIDGAVEELLRFDGPLALTPPHYAAADVELDGTRIPQGSQVHVAVGAANRDEGRFPDPDRLDITRDANRHLAFGQGIHYCLGAQLARLQGRIALLTLIQQLPRLRLAVAAEELAWRPDAMLRGLTRLPVRF
jgi:cytochrome P450